MATLSDDEARMYREEAGLGVCSDPRREFGRDYRIIALLDELDAIKARLAKVEALADDLLDELAECRSFISVETRHYPTVTQLSEVIKNARAALASDPTHAQDATNTTTEGA